MTAVATAPMDIAEKLKVRWNNFTNQEKIDFLHTLRAKQPSLVRKYMMDWETGFLIYKAKGSKLLEAIPTVMHTHQELYNILDHTAFASFVRAEPVRLLVSAKVFDDYRKHYVESPVAPPSEHAFQLTEEGLLDFSYCGISFQLQRLPL